MTLKTVNGRFVCPIRVGDILITETPKNPSNTYAGTTWELTSVGRAIVGIDPDDPDFNKVNKQLGEKEHVLTLEEMAKHGHVANTAWPYAQVNSGITYGHSGSSWVFGKVGTDVNVEKAGSDQPHNNIQPSEIKYIWKRLS